MPETLLDTSILVDMFRGHAQAVLYVNDLLTARKGLLHPPVLAELLDGARNNRE